MPQVAILYPVLVQVLLTVVVLGFMGRARYAFLSAHRDRDNLRELAVGRGRWSDEATKAARNFTNQFEVPVLFYAVVAFAMITRTADGAMVALAWLFAVSRIVHAGIQIGPNVVAWRFAAYLVGLLAVVAMWGLLAVRTVWAG